VTQYLRLNEWVADSQKLTDANPKYWVKVMSGGIFSKIWPLEKGHTLTSPPAECNQSRAVWASNSASKGLGKAYSSESPDYLLLGVPGEDGCPDIGTKFGEMAYRLS
jgi:hypothetical protein